MRGFLSALLSEDPFIEVVDKACDGMEAIRKASALWPDVILMDLHMPNCGGHEATSRILKEMPTTKIIINTISEQESDLVAALTSGARGYLLKADVPELAPDAIHYVARGGILISPAMAEKFANQISYPGWTKAEEHLKPFEDEMIDEVSIRESERSLVEPHTDFPARLGDSLEAEQGALVSEVELIVPPPLEPTLVLKLHSLLVQELGGELERVLPTMNRDTVLEVSFASPTPVERMLSGLDIIDNIASESIPMRGEKTPRLVGGRVRYRLAMVA